MKSSSIHTYTHKQINRGNSTWNNSGVFCFFLWAEFSFYGKNKQQTNNYIQVVKKNILIK